MTAATTFTPDEAAYLRAATLGRLSTLVRDGSPTVVPVTFDLADDDATLQIHGHRLEASAKARNLARDDRFAFVVDDGVGETARGVLVRGRADVVTEADGSAWLQLHPTSVTSWGVDTHPFTRQRRDVV